ncbi:glycosyltransferase 87 family protein [Actinophytocola sp.]|uniref:glycosyltransferase 87 family protein n=1 Tax=Actinophytocola sp. TaxID=1872138 RepID=UPI002D72ABCA|nr:glycosyltransferase 87 family protein [Actinophytocola sp.]HYQ65555.1 glycosyltransferase 87 family protein [Actinophytocola sp.]
MRVDAPVAPPAQHWLRDSLRRLFARPRLVLALFAVPVGVLAAGVVSWAIDWRLGVDSAVYRSGAVALLTGEPLYDHMSLSAEPPWARLPFTYPPTGALLFIPLALFATQISWGVLGALSVLALALVVRVAIQNVPSRPTWMTPARTTVAVTVLALGLEPVWRTLLLGQINIILMALVVVDVLLLKRSRYLGGVLVGVAAVVKLTPLIFVPHLWLTGRRKDAVTAVATFGLLQLLIFAIIPHDFTRFWSVAVTNPERTGPTFWAGNQSLDGLMLRLTDLAPWALGAAIAIGAVLAVPAVLLVRRYHRAGQPLTALLVTAFFGILLSPVSWSHHYVWVVPLVVLLLSRLPDRLPDGWDRVRALSGIGAVVLVFASCVLLIMRTSDPNRPAGEKPELEWTPPEVLLGSAYLLVPLVAGVIVLTRLRRR